METRLTAMATLTLVLTHLSPPLSQAHVPIMESCISLMESKGYISVILGYLDVKDLTYPSVTAAGETVRVSMGLDTVDSDELIRSAVAVCQQIAIVPHGVHVLLASSSASSSPLKSNLFALISSLRLAARYPLPITDAPSKASSSPPSDESDAVEYMQLTMLPVLRLLATIGTVAPSLEVLRGLASLVLGQWRGFIHDVLSFRCKSLLGMQLLDVSVQLLQMIVGMAHSFKSDGLSSGAAIDLFRDCDVIGRDMQALLVTFGKLTAGMCIVKGRCVNHVRVV